MVGHAFGKFMKCLLSTYCVPDTMLGRGVKMVNKMEIVPSRMIPRVYWGMQQVRGDRSSIGCLGVHRWVT